MNNQPATNTGFSLIELMVAVSIAAIVMAIAIPSYTQYVMRGRRAAAQSCLAELSQFMERAYTTDQSYAVSGAALPGLTCINDLTAFYTFSYTPDPTATTYTAVATVVAGSAQEDDDCGDMSVNNAGVKTPDTDGCWR